MSQVYEGVTFLGEPKPVSMDNHAHAVENDGDLFHNCTFDANGASEALKASEKWDVDVIGGQSIGGVEDCIDFVRGGALLIQDHGFTRGRALQDVTIKGGFNGADFDRNVGLRRIVAGEYTKYDAKAIYPDGRTVKASPFKCCRPGVRGGHVTAREGEPKVVVELWHSDDWTGDVINKRRIPRFLVPAYFWIRATFFKEANPAPESEFRLDPREL